MLTKEAYHLYFYRFFTLLRLKPVSSGVEMLSTGVQNETTTLCQTIQI